MCGCEEQIQKLEARVHTLETEAVAQMRALADKLVPISEQRVEKLTSAYRESLNDYTNMVVELQLEKKKMADTLHQTRAEVAQLNQQIMLLTATSGGDQLTKLQITVNDLGGRILEMEKASGIAHS